MCLRHFSATRGVVLGTGVLRLPDFHPALLVGVGRVLPARRGGPSRQPTGVAPRCVSKPGPDMMLSGKRMALGRPGRHPSERPSRTAGTQSSGEACVAHPRGGPRAESQALVEMSVWGQGCSRGTGESLWPSAGPPSQPRWQQRPVFSGAGRAHALCPAWRSCTC